MEMLPKLIYLLNMIPIKIPLGFFGRNWYTDPKIHMEVQSIVKRILKEKNKIGRLVLLNLKFYYKDTWIISVVRVQRYTYRLVDENRVQIQIFTLQSINFLQRCQNNSIGEWIVFFSANGTGTVTISTCKNMNVGPYLTLYVKNELDSFSVFLTSGPGVCASLHDERDPGFPASAEHSCPQGQKQQEKTQVSICSYEVLVHVHGIPAYLSMNFKGLTGVRTASKFMYY